MSKSLTGLIMLILATSYHEVVSWLEGHLLACPIKKHFLIDCPGCGLQRSVVALMRGDVAESWRMYPATLPILLLIVFTFLHIRFQFRQGAFVIKFLYIAATFLILANYLLKIKNHQLF